jgi:enterochelin esterase-like enzyme
VVVLSCSLGWLSGKLNLLKIIISRLGMLLLLGVIPSVAETPTYSAAATYDSPSIAALHKADESGDAGAVEEFWKAVMKHSAPLIEPIPGNHDFSFVTFLWRGDPATKNVVIFDGVAAFDAKDQMLRLDRTNVWFKTYKVRNDARFAYNLSPNDPLTSFDEIKGDDAMRHRLAMLLVDPLNRHRCPTTFGAYGAESSYVELPNAVPLAWNAPSPPASRGKVVVASVTSAYLKDQKKVWVYTPVGYSARRRPYPLLVLFDGDRNVDWVPRILDNLIRQQQIPPMVAVLVDDSVPSARRSELPANPLFADFLARELVPWSREKYHTTKEAARTVVAGSSYGGLAAVFAALCHPEVFGNVISLSGSFWWKPDGEKEGEWHTRLVTSTPTLPLRFYLEVGLMESYSTQVAANRHMRDALMAKGYGLRYAEFDGGHSFLTWSGGMANGLVFLMGQKN